MLEQSPYCFSKNAEKVFSEYIRHQIRQSNFAIARSIRNALERARLRQANRLMATNTAITKKDLMTIEAEDIAGSRVFTQADESTAKSGD
jgi:hypothetical protein